MIYINTNVESITVEIEGAEYSVAERTAEVIEKLDVAQKANRNKLIQDMCLAELEILLGKEAIRKLFPLGKKENIDRMQRIHRGVVQAFEWNQTELNREAQTAQVERIQDLAVAIRPLNELMRRAAEEKGSEDDRKIIHRG